MDSLAFHSWTPRVSRDFGDAIVAARQRFQESALFGDAALAALIETHPPELLDLRGAAGASGAPEILSPREVEDMSGMALLSAAHQGRLSIHLRRAMNIHPEYRALMVAAFADLRRLEARFRPGRVHGGILISSPAGADPAFADRADVILWRVRGARRAQPVAPFARGLRLDSAPADYATLTAREARALGRMPVEAAGPNLVGGLNVSVVTESASWRSNLTDGVYYTNARLRQRFARAHAR